MSYAHESFSRGDAAEVDDTQLFSDLVTFDGLQGANEGLSPANPTAAASAEHSSSAFQNTTPSVDPDEEKPATVTTNTSALVTDECGSPPAPESTNGDDGAQPPRGKKRRRSRNSPEPDYSQIIVELNKKRKRTGQACDRCRVRRYKCDPSRTGCLNCRAAGMVCKVTDCVTGETYVRGAAGRMATEIEGLKARVAELERENEELQRETKPRWNFEHISPMIVPEVSSTTILHRQHNQFIARDQKMVTLQVEIAQLRQQNAALRENNQTLRKQLESLEEILRLRNDVPLYNTKCNWGI